MQSVSEMADFVSLWDAVQEIQLTDQPDQITWKWTANGEYTSKSAYSAQFLGSYRNFHGQYIWKAESEGKHKFFAWLLVQSKILTADKLMSRHWPCNPVCSLCNHEQETAEHLVLHCHFARQVWDKLADWSEHLVTPPQPGIRIVDWWQKELVQLPNKTRKTKAGLMMYCASNLWKERNRRVFEQTTKNLAEVMQEIKLEVNTRILAVQGPSYPST